MFATFGVAGVSIGPNECTCCTSNELQTAANNRVYHCQLVNQVNALEPPIVPVVQNNAITIDIVDLNQRVIDMENRLRELECIRATYDLQDGKCVLRPTKDFAGLRILGLS